MYNLTLTHPAYPDTTHSILLHKKISSVFILFTLGFTVSVTTTKVEDGVSFANQTILEIKS